VSLVFLVASSRFFFLPETKGRPCRKTARSLRSYTIHARRIVFRGRNCASSENHPHQDRSLRPATISCGRRDGLEAFRNDWRGGAKQRAIAAGLVRNVPSSDRLARTRLDDAWSSLTRAGVPCHLAKPRILHGTTVTWCMTRAATLPQLPSEQRRASFESLDLHPLLLRSLLRADLWFSTPCSMANEKLFRVARDAGARFRSI